MRRLLTAADCRLEDRLAPANLTFDRATYLGTAGDDRATAIAVSPIDGSYLVAVDYGTSARLIRLNDTLGADPISDVDLGGTNARDLDVSSSDGRIVVVGSFGIRVYDSSLTGAPIWQQTGSFDRADISNDGTVVTLNTSIDSVTVWSPTGVQLATTTLTGTDIRSADLTIDPVTQRIFVTGYNQATSILQVPFIRAFDRSGSQLNLAWDAWDFAASAVNGANLGADSRGLRIEWGSNGSLYFLGRTDGGNTVFFRDTQTIGTSLGSRLIDPDQYTDTSNTSGAKTFTFFAKISPIDGVLDRGQILVTRLGNTQANSFNPSSIQSDAFGNVYIGGSSAFTLQNRDTQTINGQTVGSYRLGEPAILSVSADFATRRFWTALTANGDTDGATGTIAGFAVRNSTVALIGTITSPGVATVSGDRNPTPLGAGDIYFATIANASPALPTVSVAATQADRSEGDTGSSTSTFTLTRTGNLSIASRVGYAITGIGTNPATSDDFGGSFPTGTVTFAIGQSEIVVPIPISGDTIAEFDESFQLTLISPLDAILGTITADGIIRNDDAGPVVPPNPPTPPINPPVTPPISPPGTPPVTPPITPPIPPIPPLLPAVLDRVGIATGLPNRLDVQIYDAAGSVIATVTPFTVDEAPGGVRITLGDVTGDGIAEVIAVTGPGGIVRLRVLDGLTQQIIRDATFYDVGETFTGGAFVTSADVDGDGLADIALTPDQGGGARVIIVSGRTFEVLTTFFVFPDDIAFRGGARAAFGDVDGDRLTDLVISAGFQGGPRIASFDGRSLRSLVRSESTEATKLYDDFFLFEESLRDGTFIAIGDIDGDGRGDIIGGGGPNGGPRVRIVSGAALLANGSTVELANFFSGDPNTRGGVRVTTKNLDGDNRADLITGDGTQGGTQTRWYRGEELGANMSEPIEERQVTLFDGLVGGVFVG